MPSTENVEVGRQMAQGALEFSPASIAVSVTGVLGQSPMTSKTREYFKVYFRGSNPRQFK
jgi:nicotinamide mononucleotide (NMN) deamidase PncC